MLSNQMILIIVPAGLGQGVVLRDPIEDSGHINKISLLACTISVFLTIHTRLVVYLTDTEHPNKVHVQISLSLECYLLADTI